MKEEEDNDIMFRVKNGELERLSSLYDKYKKPLYGFFYNMTGRSDASADLVQNVFYRILKYRQQFKGGEFRTWMYQIARNVFYDQFKRKSFQGIIPLDKAQFQIRDEENHQIKYETNEALGLLQKAMQLLDTDKREILLLSKYQEKNYKEIGDILGLTEGNVKIRVFRAMNELKTIYHQMENTKAI